MLFVPPTTWLQARLAPARLRSLGCFAFWLGLSGAAVVALRGLLGWQASAEEIRNYAWQRMLFVLATTTDLPCGPLALAGALWWFLGRRRSGADAGALADKQSPTVMHTGPGS
jgi:hypothetical protein